MSLTSTDIARIASLARLQLAPDESERMEVIVPPAHYDKVDF